MLCSKWGYTTSWQWCLTQTVACKKSMQEMGLYNKLEMVFGTQKWL